MQKDPGNLLNLRNLMKRDPAAYYEEFQQQHRHYQANLQIFKIKENKGNDVDHFAALIEFISHVAPSFPKDCATLPGELLDLLAHHCEILEPSLRRTVVQSLILLCNRQMVSRLQLLPVFFHLFRVPDKVLRNLLFNHIVNDIKRVNAKTHQQKLNSALQNFMFTMLKDENRMAAKKSLDVMIDLWKRKVWRDEKTVNAIATVCFSTDTAMLTTALSFFLGVEDYDDEPEDEEELGETYRKVGAASSMLKGTIKNTKKRKRELKRVIHKIKKKEQGKTAGSSVDAALSLPGIHLVYDPQKFTERLFGQLQRSGEAFNVRMLMMNVISRFIGAHKLFLLNFYPFVQKYIQAHMKNVTHILTYLAQASHELVPPEVLAPCIKTLANNFVTDRSSPEVMAVGLNAIREVCARCPLVMDAELLSDLSQYKKSKQKGVMMAARSLISLFRDVNPELLNKKDRGKTAAIAVRAGEAGPLEYAEQRVATDIPGADLLTQYLEQKQKMIADGDDGDDMDDEEDDDEEEEEEVKADDDGVTEDGDDMVPLHDDDDEDEEEEGEDEDEAQPVASTNSTPRKSKKQKDGDDAGSSSRPSGAESKAEVDNREHQNGDEEEDDDDNDDEEESPELDPEAQAAAAAAAVELQNKKRKLIDMLETATEKPADPSAPSAAAAPAAKPLPFAATKILGPEDFELLRKLRVKESLQGLKGKAVKKALKALEEDDDEEESDSDDDKRPREQVDPEDIIGYVKKKKNDKQARLASVMEGRDGRDKFGKPKEKGGGKTNAEKARNQPFQLVKHKVEIQQKKLRKFSSKQATASTHIKGLKKMASRKHRNNKRSK